jgi:hypothetical protein
LRVNVRSGNSQAGGDSRMIALISSAGEEIYKQFVLRVLCYPTGHILADVPYSLDRVASPFDRLPCDLTNEKGGAVIVLVDYVRSSGADPLKPIFLPLREATIVKARRIAGKLLLDVRLGDCCFYDAEVKAGYANQITDARPRIWSAVISSASESPRPMRKDPARPIDPDDHTSWVSTGKFVLEIARDALDFRVFDRAESVRTEYEDWKSVVDMITQRGQFDDKLFYQIWGLRKPAIESIRFQGLKTLLGRLRLRNLEDHSGVKVLTLGERTVYQLMAGDSAELGLHFYHGQKRLKNIRRSLEVTTDDAYLATLGMVTMDVYAGQTSGKIEQLRLIARKQLSQQFTRLTIQEKADPPALATTELYVRIQPRRWHIAIILIAFLLGTFLNSLPEQTPRIWLWKVVGAALMTGAFWLAFSKFPKAD